VGGVGAVGAPQLREVLQGGTGGTARGAAPRQEVQVLVLVGFQVLQVVLRYVEVPGGGGGGGDTRGRRAVGGGCNGRRGGVGRGASNSGRGARKPPWLPKWLPKCVSPPSPFWRPGCAAPGRAGGGRGCSKP
jgi:hypothetical protein